MIYYDRKLQVRHICITGLLDQKSPKEGRPPKDTRPHESATVQQRDNIPSERKTRANGYRSLHTSQTTSTKSHSEYRLEKTYDHKRRTRKAKQQPKDMKGRET